MTQRKIIWFAIFASTFIYAVIVYSTSKPDRTFEESFRQPLVIPMYVMAVVEFFLALVLVPKIVRSSGRNRMIVSLAVYEACAIFGLMAAFIAHDWRLYLGPWALALIGFMREWPADPSVPLP
jgi:hypothetical protein